VERVAGRLIATLVVVLGMLGTAARPSGAATCKPASSEQKLAARDAYRARFPFLMQGVGRMESSPGCAVLVIAEPPPHVRIPDLVAAVDIAELADEVLIMTNRFGGDGWTKDLVVTIDSDRGEQTANTISLMHRYLFGTSFRAWTVDLDVPPTPIPPAPLDFGVSTGDLYGWVFDPSITFLPMLGGSAQSGIQLINHAPLGVYEAETAPLVAWVLNIGPDLEVSASDPRQFAMASDLVLGAVLSASRVLVIGRIRSVPFEVLPALRTETMSLLAHTGDALGQSYERMSPLAGVHGQWSKQMTSWAPIYLSPDLIDTEYGSLLNLTDQLLKSWSNAGKTRYENFAYPVPPRWPFGVRSVYDQLGVEALTYNWNTKEFAQIYSSNYSAILSFRTTGALPLDYLPSSGSTTESRKASEIGRSYFASLSEPNLVRVVQYAALYHIFRTARMEVTSIATTQPNQSAHLDGRTRFMEDAALTMLKAYAREPNHELQRVADRIFDTIAPKEVPRTPEMRSILGNKLIADRSKSLIAGLSDTQLQALAKLWVSPPLQPTATQQRELDACNEAKSIMHGLVDIAKIRFEYLATLPVRTDTWIHTATWVVSTNDSMASGGHNIDFALRPIKQLPNPVKWQSTIGVTSPRPTTQTTKWDGWRNTPGTDRAVLDGYRGTSNVRVARIERMDGHYMIAIDDRKFTAWTLADAADAIANVMRTQRSSIPLRLHFEKFTGAEARNARFQVERAVNMKGGQHQIEAVAHGGSTSTAARAGGQMQASRGAAVRQFKVVGDNVVEAKVAAPSSGRLKGFVAKIKIVFSGKVTATVRVKAKQLIESVLKRLPRTGRHTDISTELQRELTTRLKAEKIPASVEIEAGDIWVVVRDVSLVQAGG
jgi:hypothetical protein